MVKLSQKFAKSFQNVKPVNSYEQLKQISKVLLKNNHKFNIFEQNNINNVKYKHILCRSDVNDLRANIKNCMEKKLSGYSIEEMCHTKTRERIVDILKHRDDCLYDKRLEHDENNKREIMCEKILNLWITSILKNACEKYNFNNCLVQSGESNFKKIYNRAPDIYLRIDKDLTCMIEEIKYYPLYNIFLSVEDAQSAMHQAIERFTDKGVMNLFDKEFSYRLFYDRLDDKYIRRIYEKISQGEYSSIYIVQHCENHLLSITTLEERLKSCILQAKVYASLILYGNGQEKITLDSRYIGVEDVLFGGCVFIGEKCVQSSVEKINSSDVENDYGEKHLVQHLEDSRDFPKKEERIYLQI